MKFLVVYALGLAFLLSVFTYAELAVSASTWKRTRRLAEFGAISNCSTTSCAQKNGDAFLQATRESKPGDVVLFEPGELYYFIPALTEPIIYNLSHVTFQIESLVRLHDNFSAWPMSSPSEFHNAFDIRNSSHITVTGDGTIDGQGEKWWWGFFLGTITRKRPTMFYFENLRHSKIERLQLFDAPRFNVDAYSVFDFVVRNMTIWVNTELQKKISGASTNIPMFPFNTDGIDVHGRLIHVHDINISNFDDAVAVKSSSMEDVFQCTENVLIERISVFLGVGLSIGSVPPTVSLRCVRNVTFRHINAVEPLKFIYIKTGESSSEDNSNNGAALIENITYENMKATSPVFWPIYLGPQQQSEPDGTGQGWIQVPTNPDVTIRNIVFRNITVINNRLRAGVLRCNSTNPCTGIVFSNVIVEGGLSEIDGGYICDDSSALVGYFDTLSHPVPDKCMALSEAKTVQPRNPF